MTVMEIVNERCEQLKEPGFLSLTVAVVLLVGLLVSYLPQHYRIIARRTSEGISPYFVLLGVTSATSAFANIVTLPQSRQDVACCKVLGTFECVAGLLGIAQLGVQWFCFVFILVLFLVFFRMDDALVSQDEVDELDRQYQPSWQTALLVAQACFLHAFLVIAVTVTIAIAFPDRLGAWANVLGIMASALATVQYLPQIWTTYHLKHAGSLSIPMMCMQTPGGYVFAASLYARLGPAGWSSWGLFVLTASMQGIVLVMAIYYETLRRGHREVEDSQVTRPLRSHSPSRRAIDHRIYAPNGTYDDDMPGPYTAHIERYADTEDDFETMISREESQAAAENTPLLRRGGIGDPHRNEPMD